MKLRPTINQRYFPSNSVPEVPSIMIGTVVNVNDPQQMGRLQVLLPALSDNSALSGHNDNKFFPWVSYGSPFGGIDDVSSRGPGEGEKTPGGVAYGMWAIPKEGSRVLVCAVDNDPNQLYWIGCIYPNSSVHTLPHGRFSDKFNPKEGYIGPMSSTEKKPIQPSFNNQQLAFTDGDRSPNEKNHEWLSRGADYSVAAATPERVGDGNPVTKPETDVPDDQDVPITLADGSTRTYRQGYSTNRTDPNKAEKDLKGTLKNLQSSVVSLTTPGFHSFSMDDREENGRIRFRTTTGHQIILDDTNERIYISTNQGKNYIEMDSNGQIYIYSKESVSIRAEGDLNLTSEKTVRITGNEGVHIESHGELRFHAVKDVFIKGDQNLFQQFDQDINIRSGANMMTSVVGTVDLIAATNHIELSGVFDVDAGSSLFNTGAFEVGSTTINIDAAGNITAASGFQALGGDVHSSNGQSLNSLNGHTHEYIPGDKPPADTVGFSQTDSVSALASAHNPTKSAYPFANDSTDLALWSNIVPAHEPWARTFTADKDVNLTHNPEFAYTDIKINKEMTQTQTKSPHQRGSSWRR